MSVLPDNPRISIITQARMTSTRLPGKILRLAAGKSFLQHHIDRLKETGYLIILATTTNHEDDLVAAWALQNNIHCFRGDEHDVLGRFYLANQLFPADIIVRVTSDCPLIDASLIQQGIAAYISLNDDRTYVSNCFPRTYARGFDFEIFSALMLEEAHHEAKSSHDREHVTPFMRTRHANRMHNIAQQIDHGNLRLTLDTPEDLAVLTHMLEESQALEFGYEAIEEILLSHPEWIALNSHIEQKKI
jgi:spore coat polysaccharide biosynthesis protein SpsF